MVANKPFGAEICVYHTVTPSGFYSLWSCYIPAESDADPDDILTNFNTVCISGKAATRRFNLGSYTSITFVCVYHTVIPTIMSPLRGLADHLFSCYHNTTPSGLKYFFARTCYHVFLKKPGRNEPPSPPACGWVDSAGIKLGIGCLAL